jgi:hypothetical protein
MGGWPAFRKPESKFKLPLLIWARSQANTNEGQWGQGQSGRPWREKQTLHQHNRE